LQDEYRKIDQSSEVLRSEFMNDSEFDIMTDQHRSRLQERPHTVVPGGRSAQMDKFKPMPRPKSKQALRGNDLQRVYGNIIEMTGFDDQDYRNRPMQNPSRVGSGKRG
jgi:hypothetical protein